MAEQYGKKKIESEKVSQGIEKTKQSASTNARSPLYIGNSSTTRRGFMLSRGQIVLDPYEIKEIPAALEDEVRKLFACKSMQVLVDEGFFQIGSSPILQLNAQKTISPPESLGTSTSVGAAKAVAGSSTSQVGGSAPLSLDSSIRI